MSVRFNKFNYGNVLLVELSSGGLDNAENCCYFHQHKNIQVQYR